MHPGLRRCAFAGICVVVILPSVSSAQTKRDSTSRIIADGQFYEGKIIRETHDSLFLRTREGTVLGLLERQVSDRWSYAASPFLSKSWAIGGAIGTPGGLNFIGGYYDSLLVARVELGFAGIVAGYQFNLGFVFYRSSVLSLELTGLYMGMGSWGNSARGPGGSIALNLSGFFVETGYIVTDGDYMPPNYPVLQIGYVH